MQPDQKPNWPHGAICKMSAHVGAGQWYRTIQGKPIYFGVLRNPDAALRKYLAYAANSIDHRQDNKEQPTAPVIQVDPGRLTLDIGLNHFLCERHKDVNSGSLSPAQYLCYKKGVDLVFATFGKRRLINELRSTDFETLKSKLKGKPRTIANAIRDIRVGFKWVDDTYGVRPLYGQSFKRPTARAIRRGSGKRQLFSASEILAMLAVADANMRAKIFLGINCAFGQMDCAMLTLNCMDLNGHNFPRPKTDIERRCVFWPETIAAIACRRRWRPDLYPELLFLSKYGRILVRDEAVRNAEGIVIKTKRKDAIQQMFRRCCADAKVKWRPFYTLRHTFRSVADRVPDATAIRAIMGHSMPGMDSVYVQLMADDAARLKAVTNVVHNWLFDS